ncbi:MAG: DUF5674 family protein [Streptococcaceae bacterium]|jgi:hypothetical protein|nr:DUF5674 family protein [Streptococcaceae bacterium]
MELIESITVGELTMMAEKMYGDMLKAVVDVEKGLLVVDMELHADGEQFLLAQGSKQSNLWGLNLYPSDFGENMFIEFDSLINIRPSDKNFSRSVENEELQHKIRQLVENKVSDD